MTNKSYFSHDSDARNDSRVLRLRMRHGAAGYGVYFMLLERLREADGYAEAADWEMLAFDLHVEAELVKSVVEDFGLFTLTDDGRFLSVSFCRRMEAKDEVQRKRSEAGRRGGIIKPTASDDEANDKQCLSKSEANDKQCLSKSEASKVKESKEKKVKKEKPPKTAAEACAPARGEAAAADGEAQTDIDRGLRMLAVKCEWREALWMNHHIRGDDEYRRLLEDFKRECVCNGKTRHEDLSDLRRHFNAWLRIRLQTKGERAAATVAATTITVPTADDLRREREEKEAEERKRVEGIYQSAKAGCKRQLAIVRAWAENGVLAKYGLSEL